MRGELLNIYEPLQSPQTAGKRIKWTQPDKWSEQIVEEIKVYYAFIPGKIPASYEIAINMHPEGRSEE